MKKFFVFLTLIFSIAASANVDSFETYQDSIQEGKIEAAYLNMLSSDLREAREAYNAKAENMPEPYDMIEGKIQAAMFNMIDGEFDKADVLYRELGKANSIDDESTKTLRKKTALILRLIEEL